ncbi:MAG: hypothetical protein II896_04540 [Clostridia bacterium]|nr:hypothetical protein [Clostridia bacterium]
MKKKLLVSLIAIVLVAAVAGSCFALYSVNATNKVVSISAGYQVVNMQFKNADNSAVLADVDFDDAFSPDLTTQTVDVVLAITNGALADGVHGLFTAALTGTLASHVDVTVNLLTAVGGSLSTDITASATGAGYDIALSATPVAVRITVALKAADIADFASAAETTGTLTLTWAKVAGSVFTYDDNAYYVVGTVNGVTAWYPCATSVLMNDTPGEGNQAKKASVTLQAGDSIKVVKGYETSATWYSGQESNNTVTGVSGIDGDGNVQIDANGTYDIYVNTSGQIWVAVAGS